MNAMTLLRWGLIGALAIVLAACAQYTLVKPGEITVGDTLRIHSSIDWSRRAETNKELWTVDGSGLNEIVFLTGIGNDQPIIPGSDDKKKIPVYRSGMTAIEIAEAIQAVFVSSGVTNFQLQRLRPHQIGKVRGFRFDFSYATKSGLEMRGLVAGAVKDDKLSVIMYDAPRLYFFDKYKGEVESMVDSARFI